MREAAADVQGSGQDHRRGGVERPPPARGIVGDKDDEKGERERFMFSTALRLGRKDLSRLCDDKGMIDGRRNDWRDMGAGLSFPSGSRMGMI